MGIIKPEAIAPGHLMSDEILVDVVGDKQDTLFRNLYVAISIPYDDLVDILAKQVDRFGRRQRDRQHII